MNKRYCVTEKSEPEQTPMVKMLLLLLEQFAQRIHEQDEETARLKDEINRLGRGFWQSNVSPIHVIFTLRRKVRC